MIVIHYNVLLFAQVFERRRASVLRVARADEAAFVIAPGIYDKLYLH
jgi:hypothetical protein